MASLNPWCLIVFLFTLNGAQLKYWSVEYKEGPVCAAVALLRTWFACWLDRGCLIDGFGVSVFFLLLLLAGVEMGRR